MARITLPEGARDIVSALENAGFEAFVVGGCVRDALLGLEPADWDVCTSARPDDVLAVFAGRRVIKMGIRHGTVAVAARDGYYEVTTYRIDGAYSDSRRPDSVTFTDDIIRDLARRDFTVNAMAYGEKAGLIDPFGGKIDLERRIIRCVGDPAERFSEDALRIMRALRFASVYGFDIEPATAKAIHEKCPTLNKIAPERLQTELSKLLLGGGALPVLLGYADVIAALIPELAGTADYEASARALAAYTGRDISVKLALLLRELGDGAGAVLTRLRYDNAAKNEALRLIANRGAVIEPTGSSVRRWLNRLGPETLARLIDMRRAEGAEPCGELSAVVDNVLNERQCYTISGLAVNGRDLLALGLDEGAEIGKTLEYVLSLVLDGDIPNERDAELDAARRFLFGQGG